MDQRSKNCISSGPLCSPKGGILSFKTWRGRGTNYNCVQQSLIHSAIPMFDKINWFQVILYFSLGFLTYNLYKADYLYVPVIYSISKFCLSIISLFIGMVVMSNNWRTIINNYTEYRLSLHSSISANGLSIFTKYIPGKVMTILGRSIYTSMLIDLSKKESTILSFKTQIIMIWVGLLFGLPFLFLTFSISFFVVTLTYIAVTILFSVSIFSKKLHVLIAKIVKKVLNKNLDIPVLEFRSTLDVLPNFFLTWLLWSISFWLLASSLVDYSLPLIIGLSFPFAAVVGIVAIISPGGLGVREGILVLALSQFTEAQADAVTIATISRLWFLCGEIFLFVLAIITNHWIKNVKG